jgi:hypothetical protein
VILSKAVGLKIPIVTEDFITAVLGAGGTVKLSKYSIVLEDEDNDPESISSDKGKEEKKEKKEKKRTETPSSEEKKESKDQVSSMDVESEEGICIE